MVVLVGGIVPDEDVAKLEAAGIRGVFGRSVHRDDRGLYPAVRSRRGEGVDGGLAVAPRSTPRRWRRACLPHDRLLLARAITHIENEGAAAHAILGRVYAHAGAGTSSA